MDQKDLKQIKEIIKSEFANYDKKIDAKFEAQDKRIDMNIESKMNSRIGQLEQKMFEWKSEIIDVVDGLAKEIRDEREFRDVSGHQTADNTRRIGKLEQKVFGVAES